MQEWIRNDWNYPTIPLRGQLAPRRRDGHDAGVSHRYQLLVQDDYWPYVERWLVGRGLDVDPLSVRHKFGLTRIRLPRDYESLVLTGAQGQRLLDVVPPFQFGRNRLLGYSHLELDDDPVDGQPKIWGSGIVGAGRPELAPPDLPPPAQGDRELGAGIVVGVVDSAWLPHPFLDGRCTYERRDLPTAAQVRELGPVTSHATFVAGLIAQNAPGASLDIERVMSPQGVAEALAVHDAICRLTVDGADIINLSLGCYTADDEIPFVLDHALTWAIARRRRRGQSPPYFVAASGNSRGQQRFWPAADPRVTAVASAMRTAAQWRIDPDCGTGKWVSVAAPGHDVLSTWTSLDRSGADRPGWAYWSGTSFATAIVSGILAADLSPQMAPAGGAGAPVAPNLDEPAVVDLAGLGGGASEEVVVGIRSSQLPWLTRIVTLPRVATAKALPVRSSPLARFTLWRIRAASKRWRRGHVGLPLQSRLIRVVGTQSTRTRPQGP